MNANDVLTQWRAQIYDPKTPTEHWVHMILRADTHGCLDATIAWAWEQASAPEEMRRVLGLMEMVGVGRIRRAARLMAELPGRADQADNLSMLERTVCSITPGAFVERAVVMSSSVVRITLVGGWSIELSSGFHPHIYAPPAPEWMAGLGAPRNRLAGVANIDGLGTLVWALYTADEACGQILKTALDWTATHGRLDARKVADLSRLLGACCGDNNLRLSQSQVFDLVCDAMAQFGIAGERSERRWFVKDGTEFSRLWYTPIYGGMTLWLGTDICGDVEPLADSRVPLYVEYRNRPELGFGPVRPTSLTPLLDPPDYQPPYLPQPRGLLPRFA